MKKIKQTCKCGATLEYSEENTSTAYGQSTTQVIEVQKNFNELHRLCDEYASKPILTSNPTLP